MHGKCGQSMTENRKIILQQSVIIAAAIALSSIVTVHFRTYLMRPPDKFQFMYARKAAEEKMIGQMQQFAERNLARQFPNLDPEKRKQVAAGQVQTFRQSDPLKYDSVIADAIDKNLLEVRYSPKGRIYLLEADPYYYCSLTEMLRKTGKLGTKQRPGFFFNPYRCAPAGAWEEMTWHPYLGLFWGRFVTALKPGCDWVKALGTLPILLAVVSVFAFYFVCFVLRLSLVSACLGSFTLSLAPMFLQRSCFGWYDTDPYNVIFSLLIIGLFLLVVQDRRYSWMAACAAGFFTGMYSLFWTGWVFILGLLMTIGGVLCVLDWLKGKPLFGNYFRCTLIYLIFTAIFAAVFMSPERFFDSFARWVWIGRYVRGDRQLWPNALFGTGEIAGVTPLKLLYLTGNYLTLGLATFGVAAYGLWAFLKKDEARLRNWIVLVGVASPLLMMCVRSERFTLLFIVPFSLLCTLGIEMIYRPLATVLDRLFARWPRRSTIPLIVFFLLFAVMGPFSFGTANEAMTPIMPIMNDAWYEVLTEIRDRSPEDAVVYSWWPPGYFVISVAQRKVFSDGGSQHRSEVYWIARLLLSDNEREAAGIIRMLNSGQNAAAEYLNFRGWDLQKVIDLLGKLLVVDREEGARLIPEGLAPKEKERFLELVYGKDKLPASYVMVYDDLIRQNIMLTIIARWDFAKAKEAFSKEIRYGSAVFKNYVSYMMNASQDVLKYTPEADLINRDGNVLNFANGLRVDLETMTASASVPPGSGAPYVPLPLFYMEDGKFTGSGWDDASPVRSAAMLIRKGDRFTSVLADAPLLRSMLYRFYYLNGEGMKYFRPFASRAEANDGGRVSVFELNPEAVEGSAEIGTKREPEIKSEAA